MINYLIYVNIAVFIGLAVLHLYWGFGGNWAYADRKQTNPKIEQALGKSKADCFLIALCLINFSSLSYFNLLIFYVFLKPYFDYITLFIGLIFLLRAIGDFNCIGMFKKVRGTKFSKHDNLFYIPISIYLAISCLLIVILS